MMEISIGLFRRASRREVQFRHTSHVAASREVLHLLRRYARSTVFNCGSLAYAVDAEPDPSTCMVSVSQRVHGGGGVHAGRKWNS